MLNPENIFHNMIVGILYFLWVISGIIAEIISIPVFILGHAETAYLLLAFTVGSAYWDRLVYQWVQPFESAAERMSETLKHKS